MARAIVYLRVSTEEQAESGLGLEAQEEACREYIVRNGHVADGPYREEGLSGAVPLDKRPALLDAIGALGKGDDSPSSILFRRMIDAFAEYERLIIAARTRAALRAKIARGERSGSVPYGKRIDPDHPARSRKSGLPCGLAADPIEQVAVECIRNWRAGGLSLGNICRRLNDENIPTKGGRPWAKSTVHALLKRLQREDQRTNGPAPA